MKQNLGWILIILGGICEIFWVSGLKYADSTLLYALTALGVLFSFCCMIIACKSVEVSVAYAVFVGIGAGGVVVAEIVYFKEPASVEKVALIVLLIIGVIGLKLVSKDGDESVADSISHELGLDEVADELNKHTK